MIILPDRTIDSTKILMPVPRREWYSSSQAQQKDQFGRENRTYFRLCARLNDGHVSWTGWFEDRNDFDAFLLALITGSLQYERPLWKLPVPAWHPGIGYGADVWYAADTVTFLTSPTGSLQNYTIPSDFTGHNKIECIGAGASGGWINSNTGERLATGGGGGGYGIDVNRSLSGTPQYQIGTGGATTSVAPRIAQGNGNNGGDTWFNGASYAAATVGGGGGQAGLAGTVSPISGGAGGAAGPGTGGTNRTGGSGGTSTGSASGRTASGGGGAAGPNGDGVTGTAATNTTSGAVTSAGGAGDNGSGGAGSSGGSTSTAAGGNGTEWTSNPGGVSAGSGGASGGCASSGTGVACDSGIGGNYGGSSGASAPNTTGSGGSTGAGAQGIIVVTYTPFSSFNFPNTTVVDFSGVGKRSVIGY